MARQQRPTPIYTTPTLVSQQLHKADETSSNWGSYNTLIERYCKAYSRIVEGQLDRAFIPYTATRTYYFDELLESMKILAVRNAYELSLDEDLLSITSLTWDSTALTSSDYRLGLTFPYREIRALTAAATIGTDFTDTIDIVGVWGVHDNEGDMFTDVDTLGAEVADTTTTSVTVTNGTLFNALEYIRVDSELMLIQSIATNVLTVERGARGYTAATHTNGTTVERFNVVHDVQELVTRLVAYHWSKRDDLTDSVEIVGVNILISKFSQELEAVIKNRELKEWGAV